MISGFIYMYIYHHHHQLYSPLLCCLSENWTEEGELQCWCPHIYIPHPVMCQPAYRTVNISIIAIYTIPDINTSTLFHLT